MKKAFTLAEVLITLAIIGIVAALTIPTLVSKNEKKQLYTQFMKTYNTITNALNLAVAEHGDPKGWTGDENNMVEFLNKYFLPNFKVAKVCNTLNHSECMPLASYIFLNNENSEIGEALAEVASSGEDGAITVAFADGSSSLVFVGIEDSVFQGFDFYIDTNGFKGPNVLGRDVHVLEFMNRDGKYMLRPAFSYETERNGETIGSYGESYNNCDISSNNPENGTGCAARMLKEGGMNY